MSEHSLDNELTHLGVCRSCPAPVVWSVYEASGKAAPLDRAPDPDGRVVIEGWQACEHDGEPGMMPVVRVLKVAELEADQRARYTSHFATCPNAAQHRRK